MRAILIENDPILSQLLVETFSLEGCEVLTWPGALTTVDVLRTVAPDLILLDMPYQVEDGWELLRMLRMDPRTASIPLIIICDDRRAVDRHAPWLRAEGIPTFPKPFELDELLTTVEQVVRPTNRRWAVPGT